MTANLLEVSDLNVVLRLDGREIDVVRDVGFSLAPGEILAIVGESGAGKSVACLAVTGLLEPGMRIKSGRIALQGQRIEGLGRDEAQAIRGSRIGSVFQNPFTCLDPLFTVERQLVETIRRHTRMGRAEARARAAELLAQVGLRDVPARLAQYPHELSGGTRQRVAIALALAGNPALIVADEPTTALDVSVQAQIMGLIRSIASTHKVATLLVTHDFGMVARIADRVGVMYAGRLIEIGTVAEVLGAPRHPYTKGLIASVPRIGRTKGRMARIEGVMPRLGHGMDGCAFRPRCPRAVARCAVEIPPLRGDGAAQAACWNSEREEAQIKEPADA